MLYLICLLFLVYLWWQESSWSENYISRIYARNWKKGIKPADQSMHLRGKSVRKECSILFCFQLWTLASTKFLLSAIKREGKGGKVSVCQAEFPLQQPPLLSLGKLLEWCNPTHPTRAWATSTAAFCVYVQLTGAKRTALSIILISQCFSSLFSPGSHGNQHVVVWLQCCCRRIPVTAAPGHGGAALTSNSGTHSH